MPHRPLGGQCPVTGKLMGGTGGLSARLILRRGLETVETGGRKLAIRKGSTAEVALKKGVPLTLKIGLPR